MKEPETRTPFDPCGPAVLTPRFTSRSVPDSSSLLLHGLEEKQNPTRTSDPSEEPAALPTPDVDQLLQCSFYMKKSEEDEGQEEEFLSPLAEFRKEMVVII